MVGAIRAHVEPAYGASLAFVVRVALENVGGEVAGRWVVGGVHADGCGAMVLGHGHWPAEAHFQPGASTAAATKKIDHDFVVLRAETKSILGFEIEVLLLVCRHEKSLPVYWQSIKGDGYGCFQNCAGTSTSDIWSAAALG
ncbi:hypothetical protein D3C80_1255400 [compost metagenome]